MFRANELVKGDRFIPADDVSIYRPNEHLVFDHWSKREAVGYFHGNEKLGLIPLRVYPNTDCLLARPRHAPADSFSI